MKSQLAASAICTPGRLISGLLLLGVVVCPVVMAGTHWAPDREAPPIDRGPRMGYRDRDMPAEMEIHLLSHVQAPEDAKQPAALLAGSWSSPLVALIGRRHIDSIRPMHMAFKGMDITGVGHMVADVDLSPAFPSA